jgi:hypothetical protein
MLGKLFYKRLLTTQLPGLNGAQIWQVLANKFQLDYELLYDSTHTWFPVFITVVFGLAVFILLYAARFWVSPGYSTGSALARPRSSAPLGIVFLLLLGSVLAPIPVLAGDYNSYDCNLSDTNQWVSPGSIFLAASRRTGWVDVIPRYEAAGALLEKLIPPGSKVFWAGYSPVVLLYLPGVEIYPAQLHGTYSFRISTDDDALLKYGWWNEHLAENWLNEADFVLAEQKNLGKNSWLNTAGRLDNYELVTQSAPQTCQDTTVISLYRRK